MLVDPRVAGLVVGYGAVAQLLSRSGPGGARG